MSGEFSIIYQAQFINCPKHGEHIHTIDSTIKGHEGSWCLLCLMEKLGPSLEKYSKPREEKK